MKIMFYSENSQFKKLVIKALEELEHSVKTIDSIELMENDRKISIALSNGECNLLLVDVDRRNEEHKTVFNTDLFQGVYDILQFCEMQDKELHPHVIPFTRKKDGFTFFETVIHNHTGVHTVGCQRKKVQTVIDEIGKYIHI